MNYLAHLYFAQANADSHFGNLLGDFGGKIHAQQLSTAVKKGLENHYLVDRFTDSHALVKQAKYLFSVPRRRFAGIALDVLFDHFLIRHWSSFHKIPLSQFKQSSYALLNENISFMPSKMQQVVTRMTKNDWFKEYETIEGIGFALDNIAKRIRFANQFSGSIEDITRHYVELELVFLAFFPDLIEHVNKHGLETKSLNRSSA
ncbi:ACP phosphodiesterase [Colwellia psychrerythraea]|uniref:Acyl carrier protein phosphodiesterase n=1 Tax=Colwellia psychrerythraea TaxID=28229 RepID=A0A099L4Q3_COLPS|nr:ACP phosphodiesterase [Colwellia psychrerythraea]KGJ96863.1 Acyl carrier protein phosphodiesterase [Colwellia psychrerythraea]